MRSTTRFGLFVAGAAASLGAMGAAPTAAEFARPPAIGNVVVSPSGDKLAVIVPGNDGRKRLGVLKLEPVGKINIVAAFSSLDVGTVRWVNDERLVLEAHEPDVAVPRPGRAGFWAVDADGGNGRQLIAWVEAIDSTSSSIASRVLPGGWWVDSALDDGSDDVLVTHYRYSTRGEPEGFTIGRLNTRTGIKRNLSLGMPAHVEAFLADARHEPRVLQTTHDGRTAIHWRPDADAPWVEIAGFGTLTEVGFTPWRIDSDGTLLVTSRRSGYTALYRFDPVKKQLDPEPLLAVKGYDIDGQAVADTQTGRLLGMRFNADRPMTVWFDDAMNRVQKSVDAALPGRFNGLYCGRCESTRFVVVHSVSDRHPGEYLLLDRKKGTLENIESARPWLPEATQGRRTLHEVRTRDGLTMPVYVTHPAGAADDQPLPSVVLVHGGPWVRGATLAWDADAQFLASRGYRVLQPEFRGSEGYGGRLFRAGWKAWGGAMQDDLADAVAWAAERRLTDPKRVCIMGASYGGYAALMSPIVHRDTYRCAAAHAAVTDIRLMYDIGWSDLSAEWRTYGMPLLIGDPEKDGALLDAASPLRRAGELKVPVLLAHGHADRRVPIEHARRFAAAAKGAGVTVEAVEYTDEGHGWFNPSNSADFYQRLEHFLARSLKTGP